MHNQTKNRIKGLVSIEAVTVGEEGETAKFGVSNEIRVQLPRQGDFKADVSSGGPILLNPYA